MERKDGPGPGLSARPDAAGLMALLEAGISTAELEQRLASSLAEGSIDEPTATAARRLNAQLWEAKRREGLLRVLYDTATDLTGIRDVDAILKAIVRRTRSLIGSDIAYLSLNDYDTKESYIRVTDGATTTLFHNIRMPLGIGVLGAVATGDSPAQSADYLADPAKSHLASSDAAVAAEGVKAIMGVPLKVEGKVIGALLVADRHAHEFSREDVSLMESVGTQAAVALENARHFSEMAQALAQLDQAQRENLAHVQALQEMATMDQRLMETLASRQSLPRLLELLAQWLGTEVYVADPEGRPMTGIRAQDFSAPQALAAAEESAAATVPVEFALEDKPYTAMSAIAGDQQLGSLIAAGTMTSAQLAILERSALVLSVSLLIERTLVDAEQRLQIELIDDLLSPRAGDAAALARRAGRFRLDNQVPLVVRVVAVAEDQRQKSLAAIRRAGKGLGGITALHEGHLCVVVPTEAAPRQGAGSAGGQTIVEVLRRQQITATVGSSEPVTGFSRLAGAHAEAHAVVRALQALGRDGEAADRAALGTAGMLLGAADKGFAEQLLQAQIGALLGYDAQRGSELTKTAWAFLENESLVARTAEELHIHPNTLRQRLDRIEKLLGQDWRRGGRMLDVQVALRLWRLKAAGAVRGED